MNYGALHAPDQQYMQMMFGSCEVLNVHNTWQFPDYSKYDTSAVDVNLRQWYRDRSALPLAKARTGGPRTCRLPMNWASD